MTAPDLPRGVRIDATPGHATIRIDGTPLDGVIGYQLSHDIRTGLPALIIHTTAPEGAVYEGIARVAVGVDQDLGVLLGEFFQDIDPKVLEQAALQREQPGQGAGSYTRNLLDCLTDMAHTSKGGA